MPLIQQYAAFVHEELNFPREIASRNERETGKWCVFSDELGGWCCVFVGGGDNGSWSKRRVVYLFDFWGQLSTIGLCIHKKIQLGKPPKPVLRVWMGGGGLEFSNQ